MPKKLWINKSRQVFLSNFTESSMSQDADGKYSEVKDFWRIKTYVKDEEKLLHHFYREFPEPYQVAQYYCGGTWNDYNAPFAIQVGSCNLHCFYCFVSDELRKSEIGRYFNAKEVIELLTQNTNNGVLRVTGGEPFLAPEFLIDLGKEIKNLNANQRYLWIDTNLLGNKYDDVVKALSDLDIAFGICCCFKGYNERDFELNTGASPKEYNIQFVNAKKILKNLKNRGEIFFYIPEIIPEMSDKEARNEVNSFIDKMRNDLHLNAPLRTTVLIVKEYKANVDRFPRNRFGSGKTRVIWLEELKKRYPIDLIWLPQYQISLEL